MHDTFHYGFSESNRELTAENLPVAGAFPSWLSGTLLRNGPGAVKVGSQEFRHWFDGFAMLHKFSFKDGRVDYASKFLESKAYSTAQEEGRITYSEFATDPCRSLFQRAMTVFTHKPADNAKVSIAHFADRMLALAETPIQVEFDAETLKSVGVFNYEQAVVGQMTTAHPHFDQEYMYNLVTRFSARSHYRLYRVPDSMEPSLVGQVSVMRPSYMHSFGLSQNYAIVTAFPLVVNPLSLLFWLKPFIENYYWDPTRGTPFYVINRHTGEIVGRYEADPFFAFHHVNAFEQGDEIVLDMVAYPDADIVTQYYLHRLKSSDLQLPAGNLRRYHLPLKGKKVTWETISDTCIELPHIDYTHYNMRADYRAVYGIGINPQQSHGFYNQIVKINAVTGDTLTWNETDCYPGEPVFVPSPTRITEDEGVLLSVVLNIASGSSFLLLLDASTLQEIARAQLPQAVMIGFHGAFIPSD